MCMPNSLQLLLLLLLLVVLVVLLVLVLLLVLEISRDEVWDRLATMRVLPAGLGQQLCQLAV